MARIDEKLGNPFICVIEQQKTSSGLSVAARSADFLVIGLYRIRNIRMNNEAHLTAIDSHSERVSGNDYTFRSRHEFVLDGFAIRQCQTGMVGRCFNSGPPQAAVNLLDVF